MSSSAPRPNMYSCQPQKPPTQFLPNPPSHAERFCTDMPSSQTTTALPLSRDIRLPSELDGRHCVRYPASLSRERAPRTSTLIMLREDSLAACPRTRRRDTMYIYAYDPIAHAAALRGSIGRPASLASASATARP